MRFAVDSNVLVYAINRQAPLKRAIAQNIMSRGRLLDLVMSAQVIGEFLNAVRRKNEAAFPEAIELAATWSLLFPVAWTGPDHIVDGARRAARHKLQYWDSVILEVARDSRAALFLTEDMQDGATIDGVTILNPFLPSNASRLDALLER